MKQKAESRDNICNCASKTYCLCIYNLFNVYLAAEMFTYTNRPLLSRMSWEPVTQRACRSAYSHNTVTLLTMGVSYKCALIRKPTWRLLVIAKLVNRSLSSDWYVHVCCVCVLRCSGTLLLSQGVTDVLCESCSALGWTVPTRIQEEALPVALQGN